MVAPEHSLQIRDYFTDQRSFDLYCMHLQDTATVSRLLHAVREGDHTALNDLFPMVYEELHARARRQRMRWHGQGTLNTTALVHEAYIKMVNQSDAQWHDRAHFLAVAARAMRHILIDRARHDRREKRGGEAPRVAFDEVAYGVHAAELSIDLGERAEAFLDLDAAMTDLARINERQCRVVECRYFGGMTIEETAEALGISPATVKRAWVMARAWLFRTLQSHSQAHVHQS